MSDMSKMLKSYKIKVTKVEQFDSFVKITAQNLDSPHYQQLKTELKNIFLFSKNQIKDEEIELGEMYITKIQNGSNLQYERCRILDTDDFSSIAIVDLFDSGFHGKFLYNDLRLLPYDSEIRKVPALCNNFIVGELCFASANNEQQLKRLNNLIVNKIIEMIILDQNDAGKYVDLKMANGSVSFTHDIVLKHPILKGVIKHIDLREQMKLMLTKLQSKFLSVFSSADSATYTLSESSFESDEFTSDELGFELPKKILSEKGSKVIISAYEGGPKQFYVQCVESLRNFQNLLIDLRTRKNVFVQLKNYPPRIGKSYISLMDDNHLQRIVIIDVVHKDFIKIRLIDEGTSKMIKSSQIFEMPVDLREIRPFAWMFCLSQVETLCHISQHELNFYFQFITKDKRLKLKVDKIATNREEANLCSLFDGERNILEDLKKFNPNAIKYPVQHRLEKSTNYKVKITSCDSPRSFHVNIIDSSVINHRDVFEEFEEFNSCILRNLKVGSICCIYANNVNYRGQIIKLVAPNITTCQLVDLGQIDDFADIEIKVMTEKFASFPPLAYKCFLNGFDSVKLTPQTIKMFKDICEHNELFTMNVLDWKDDQYFVKLTTNDGIDLFNKLKVPIRNFAPLTFPGTAIRRQRNSFRGNNNNCCSTAPLPVINNDWTTEERELLSKNFNDDSWDDSIAKAEVIHNEAYKNFGMISAIASPIDFTIQLKEHDEDYKQYLMGLQTLGKDSSPLTSFEENEICLAKNPFTNEWYRAVIVDANFDEKNSLISVRNIDDGSTYSYDTMDNLRKLPYQCLFKPRFGVKCSLPLRIRSKDEKQATQIMLHFIEKEMRYKILAINSLFNIIEVECDGKNIADELVNADLATRLKIIQNGNGKIAYIESLSKFYVHLDSESSTLDVMKNLSKMYEHIVVTSPTIGMLVMAKFKTDGLWYRARVISEEIEGEVEVQFIDYGNVEKIIRYDIGLLDRNLYKLEELAHCCSLSMPKDSDPNTKEALDRFKEITNDQKISIRMIKAEKDHTVISVFVDVGNGDIVDQLTPLCAKIDVNDLSEEVNDDSIQSI